MKKLLFGISLLLVPFMVNAAVDENQPVRGAAVADDDKGATIKTDVENDLAKNESIKNVVKGYYIEGFSVDCKDGKNELKYMNDRLSTNLVCENGNKTPYINVIADGTSSFANGSTCSAGETADYAYATKVLAYDCTLIDKDTDYVKPTEPTTTTTNKDDSTTSKQTGTTENKDTGVEDYFITLGVIGVSVTVVLYILDKKNSFKKI